MVSAPGETVHTELPFVAVPARIQAEHFTAMEGAATEACGDEGGGLNLGFFDPGDTLEFRIDVPEAGTYRLDYRLASLSGSEGFEVQLDGAALERRAVAATGDWQAYTTVTSEALSLPAGQHTLRFLAVGNEWNLNWFELRR